MATDAAILQAIKDAIFDLVATGGATVEWKIAGRETQHYSLDELRRLQEHFEKIVGATATGKRRKFKLASVSQGDS